MVAPLSNLPPLPLPESLVQRFEIENAALIAAHAALKASFNDMPPNIETEDQAGKCADLAAQLRSAYKEAESKRVLEKKPFDELAAVAHNWFGRYTTAFTDMGKAVISRAGAYQAAKREAERKRLADEAEAKRKEAEAIAQAGKMEAAIEVQAAAAKVEQQAAAPSVARTQGSLGGSLGSRTVWTFDVTDVKALPADMLLPNMAAIRTWMHLQVKMQKTPTMPGVTFRQETSTTGR